MAKKRTKAKKEKAPSKKDIEEALIENSVKLQKVLTNLSIKFDTLSDNIAKLLQLFEIAAKSFVKKQEEPGADADMLKKIDTLLEQNKTIANGLTLIEERVRDRLESHLPQPSSMDTVHEEPELHGVYPEHMGRPRPKEFPGF